MQDFNLNTLQSDIAKIRKTILELKEEKQWIRTSKLSKDEIIDRFNRQVDRLANENRVITRVFAEIDPFEQATSRLDEYSQKVDLGPLLCDLFGEEIKRNMTAKIKSLDYEAGPPLTERPKLLEQNADQLHHLEAAEEELICAAEEHGWFIDRRLDIRPEIFLEWEPGTTPKANKPVNDGGSCYLAELDKLSIR